MNPVAERFLNSLKSRLDPASATLSSFITEKTFINGKSFSFKRHEYQEFLVKLIEENPGFTFVWKKPSQIGLSEIANRVILGRMALRPGEGVLLSFPSKTFSQEVIKTRISDIISESPELSSLQDHNVDSASCKRFHNSSILYGLSGNPSTKKTDSLLNRPISLALIDEVDRQDPNIYTGFRSRMTHTKAIDRLVLLVSTPTAPGIGIDAEFNDCGTQYSSRLKCNRCEYVFDPDYYHHIKIPGYTDSLKTLNKLKASKLDLTQSYLECPNCDETLVYENTQVIYEKRINPDGVKKKIGVELSPFAALGVQPIPDLVESSLTYVSEVEFLNQGLGKTADLKDSSIAREEIHFCQDSPAGFRVASMDMGKVCTFMSGISKPDTTLHVDRIEEIKLSKVEDFIKDFLISNPTVCMVVDQAPYADLVYRLVRNYPCIFSAVYIDPITQHPELYKLKMQDKHDELVRQVTILKNKMMDMLANSLPHTITFEPSIHNELLIDHIISMRKVRDYRFVEPMYKWVKPTSGEDHAFHTLVYLYTAVKLVYSGVAGNFGLSGAGFANKLISSIKLKKDI